MCLKAFGHWTSLASRGAPRHRFGTTRAFRFFRSVRVISFFRTPARSSVLFNFFRHRLAAPVWPRFWVDDTLYLKGTIPLHRNRSVTDFRCATTSFKNVSIQISKIADRTRRLIYTKRTCLYFRSVPCWENRRKKKPPQKLWQQIRYIIFCTVLRVHTIRIHLGTQKNSMKRNPFENKRVFRRTVGRETYVFFWSDFLETFSSQKPLTR